MYWVSVKPRIISSNAVMFVSTLWEHPHDSTSSAVTQHSVLHLSSQQNWSTHQIRLQLFSHFTSQQFYLSYISVPPVTAPYTHTTVPVFHHTKPSQAEPSRAKLNQAKVITVGGDLREVQVDVPCQPFLRLTAQLGSVTDT